MTPPRSGAALFAISGMRGPTHRELPDQQATPDQSGRQGCGAGAGDRVRKPGRRRAGRGPTHDDSLALVMRGRRSDNARRSLRSPGPHGSGSTQPDKPAAPAECPSERAMTVNHRYSSLKERGRVYGWFAGFWHGWAYVIGLSWFPVAACFLPPNHMTNSYMGHSWHNDDVHPSCPRVDPKTRLQPGKRQETGNCGRLRARGD